MRRRRGLKREPRYQRQSSDFQLAIVSERWGIGAAHHSELASESVREVTERKHTDDRARESERRERRAIVLRDGIAVDASEDCEADKYLAVTGPGSELTGVHAPNDTIGVSYNADQWQVNDASTPQSAPSENRAVPQLPATMLTSKCGEKRGKQDVREDEGDLAEAIPFD